MKITHPTPQIPPRDSHGGPKGSAQAGTGDTTTTDGTTSTDPAVNVDLSADAQGVIAAGKGNSANSPAHQARNYFAPLSGTEDFKNFGQLVSQIARGIFPGEPEPAGDETSTDGIDPVIDETGSTAPIDDGATAEEPAVIDEPVVVDEPVAEEPVVIDEPIVVVDEPVAEEPAAEEPVIVVDEPIADEPVVIDEPIVVVDEPVAEEPAADEPIVADEPVITVEEPVVTDAELIDELTTDTTETV